MYTTQQGSGLLQALSATEGFRVCRIEGSGFMVGPAYTLLVGAGRGTLVSPVWPVLSKLWSLLEVPPLQ